MAYPTLTAFAKAHESEGLSLPTLRWQYLNRAKNGLDVAFFKFEPKGPGTGRGRVLVDPPKYWEVIRSQQSGKRAA